MPDVSTRFHPPVAEPSDWMFAAAGAARSSDKVQLLALATDQAIDVGVVGTAEPDFGRLLTVFLRHLDRPGVPGYFSGLVVVHPKDKKTIREWDVGDGLEGGVTPIVDAEAACYSIEKCERVAIQYLQRSARPWSGEIEARWTPEGISVTASANLDDDGAGAMLEWLGHWRTHQPRQARDDLFSPRMRLVIEDDGHVVGPFARFTWRHEIYMPERAPVTTQSELARALIEYLARTY
jgi:hypothetical protein